jgi:hypothetical protein
VLAAEHLLRLAGLDFGAQLVEPFRQVGRDVLPGPGPLDENGQISDAARQRRAQIDVGFERLPALQDLLRRGLILPEVGRGRLLLYSCELVGGTRGVKGSSADRSRAWRGPDTGGADRPTAVWPRSYFTLPRAASSAAAVNATDSQPARSPTRL